MSNYLSTMSKTARMARTPRTERMKIPAIQGAWNSELFHPVSALGITEQEWSAADHRLHVRRNQVADFEALLVEFLAEPVDRSGWVMPKPRELQRYELLDASQLRHQPWLDYWDFAELVAAAQVAEVFCHGAPRDLIGLDRYLTLSEMVFDCLHPMAVQTKSRGKAGSA